MAELDYNLQLNADYTTQEYSPPPPGSITQVTNISGDTTIINTINGGGGGRASGSVVTFTGGVTGYDFDASGNTVTLIVTNAATVRSAIGAAASGVNADITQFTGLTGNTGFNAWTGTPDQASHATYSGTASVGYVQAELQGVMDAVQQATGLIMALLTALLANGVVET
jgi:flagellin-like hook-associated protein FlgL